MEAVIWEALRLHPAAPFLPAHTLRDFEFEGQRIPKGSNFFFLLSEGEKRAPDYDPNFNPDRWFADGMLARAVKQLPLPFGTGQRLCPGRNLSVMEMKAMLAALVNRYQWTVADDLQPECHFNFTIDPVSIPVRFTPRQPATVACEPS
jgi:cytochrome P450